MFRLLLFSLILLVSPSVFAQNETIGNKTVIDMSRSGLPVEIILKKIALSRAAFDISTAALIELKTAGVSDEVIAAMMARAEIEETPASGRTLVAGAAGEVTFSESGPTSPRSRTELLTAAKTIAFGKSSLQPSRQALEKELLKRKDFQQMNLTILRYKEEADLFVDIGFVSGSWITHRYVYRVYDRRSGAVIAAGETTSWGSLAGNLARHIAKSLVAARAG